MGGRRPSLAYACLSLAAIAWIVAGLAYELEAMILIGFAAMAAGFALCATAVWVDSNRPARRLTIGYGLAILGLAPFLATFFPLRWSGYLAAILSFTLGLGLALGLSLRAAVMDRLEGLAGGLRISSAVSLVAPVLWIPLDLDGGGYWQPGNLLAFAGLLLLVMPRKP